MPAEPSDPPVEDGLAMAVDEVAEGKVDSPGAGGAIEEKVGRSE
jgi:hypothetical protein